MRARYPLLLLTCCCAGLSACTAAASTGPVTAVSTPAVGRPAPPSSARAALSSACMGVAGYPNSANVPGAINIGPANLAFAQPWGAWGYLGAASAQEYGFRAPAGSVLRNLGIGGAGPGSDPASLPQAEQAAIGKCVT